MTQTGSDIHAKVLNAVRTGVAIVSIIITVLKALQEVLESGNG